MHDVVMHVATLVRSAPVLHGPINDRKEEEEERIHPAGRGFR